MEHFHIIVAVSKGAACMLFIQYIRICVLLLLLMIEWGVMLDILMRPPLASSQTHIFRHDKKKLSFVLMEAEGHGTTCPNWLSGW